MEEIFSEKAESVKEFAGQQGLSWVTIPPRAPHFGGLWEAAVKSMKRHLRRIVGLQILKYEELLTVVQQIEGILNSRPLTPATNNPNDLTALMQLGTRFKMMQQIQADFWKSWQRDYLTTLQIRKRWFQNDPEIAVNALVLVNEDNQKPMMWKLERVIQVFPGNDDITRVVKLKTQSGDLIRVLVKLRKLPSGSTATQAFPSVVIVIKMTSNCLVAKVINLNKIKKIIETY